MIEDKNSKLLQICSMLHRLKVAELKYTRAQYRVSYYRKIKTAILNKKPSLFLSNNNFKWKNDLKGLNKKIEQARLNSLRAQKEYINLKDKLTKPLLREAEKANYVLSYSGGHIVGLILGKNSGTLTVLSADDWAERAAEHEATQAMHKMLSRK